MNKTLFIFFITIAFANMSKAQSYRYYPRDQDNGRPYYSIGVHAGTQGFGIDGSYTQNSKISYRLAVSYAPYGLNRTRNWGKEEYNLDMKAKFLNAAALVEYRPFNGPDRGWFLRKLTFVGGFAYFFDSKTDATATPKHDYTYGDVVIPKEDVGQVKAKIKWNSFAPYLGAGLRKIALGNRFDLNVDLGTYYLSSPDVTITADKMLSENTSNESTIKNNLKNYRWLPVVQVGVSVKL